MSDVQSAKVFGFTRDLGNKVKAALEVGELRFFQDFFFFFVSGLALLLHTNFTIFGFGSVYDRGSIFCKMWILWVIWR